MKALYIAITCLYMFSLIAAPQDDQPIRITRLSPKHKKQPPADISLIPFGSTFTNHLFAMEWTAKKGWHNARIEPYKPFTFEPASLHLHYGSEIFEGMKAFKRADNKIAVFRPRQHFERMNLSARRMCMTEIDVDFVIKALKLLIKEDSEWVPSLKGSSLYIRPTMIATEATINLKSSDRFLFFIILSPVTTFYKEGFKPISILISDTYTRASIGGVGQAKTGGNYAASMLAQQEAKKQDCSQVLWLDPIERKYLEEVGSMNIFCVVNNTIVTPALTGTILPGITRKSIIELSSKKVVERPIALNELLEAIESGACTEVFGTGTAAGITPIGTLRFKGKDYVINGNKTGPITQSLFQQLTALQQGTDKDRFGWLETVN